MLRAMLRALVRAMLRAMLRDTGTGVPWFLIIDLYTLGETSGHLCLNLPLGHSWRDLGKLWAVPRAKNVNHPSYNASSQEPRGARGRGEKGAGAGAGRKGRAGGGAAKRARGGGRGEKGAGAGKRARGGPRRISPQHKDM